MSENSKRTTHQFAATIVERLADTQSECGRIRNPVSGEEVRSQDYAQTSFATAAARVGHWRNDQSLIDASVLALESYLSTDPTHHHSGEFDEFAIQELRRSEVEMPSGLVDAVLDHIEFDSSYRTEQGNNWLLLQALCRVRNGGLWNNLVARRYFSISEKWEGPDGLLADQPRLPRRTRETPLTYHAKMAMCIVRLAKEGLPVEKRADRALYTLAQLTRPDGEFAYFGRSDNALFGYASALDAVIRRRIDYVDPPTWLVRLEERLLRFLSAQFDPTIPSVQPTIDPEYEPIDGYVEKAVYGAYAAMLLSGLPDVSFPNADRQDGSRTAISCYEKNEFDTDPVPFRHILGQRMKLTISKKGQIKWMNGGPDPRYAGSVPASLTVNGDRITTGIPSDYRKRSTFPYLPRIETNEGSFIPVTWSQVAEGDRFLFSRGHFHPVPSDWPMCQPKNNSGDGVSNASVDETSNNDTVSLSRRLVQGLVSRTIVERVVNDRRKHPKPVPVFLSRAIHTSPEEGILLIIDRFSLKSSTSPTTVYPSAATVNPVAENAVNIQTEDQGALKTERYSAKSCWGNATWICPEPQELIDELTTALIIDPNGVIDAIRHPTGTDDQPMKTRLLVGGSILDFNHPPKRKEKSVID